MRSLVDLRAPSDIRSGETRIPLKGSGSNKFQLRQLTTCGLTLTALRGSIFGP
jgi:hypothetical protein